MRSFLFENIWMLSHKDQRARRVDFHPGKNLVLGRNHTGKSSLIKTLFLTLGANPKGKLDQWDENTVSLVGFSVDGRRFSAMHQRGVRAMWDSAGRLLAAAGSHAEWTSAFAMVTGFNLILTDRNAQTVPADPRCFFLPYYVNQDGSWQSEWDTFVGLQQYKAPMGSILDYFSGIRPPEYYEAKSKRDVELKAADDLRREKKFLDKARERFSKSLSMAGPKLDPKNFTAEIDRLTSEVTELNKYQEALRDRAVRERELAASLRLQSNLAAEALRVYDSDSKFLRDEPREALVCPTCRAEHAEPFIDLLTYAEDARVLRDIGVRLNEDLAEVEKRHRKTISEISELEKNHRRISEVLDTRRGDLQFGQVVDSMGAEKAFRAFEDESVALDADLSKRLLELEKLDEKMADFTDKKRSRVILEKFRNAYASSRNALNLPAAETSKMKLTARPELSGSGGPRSILAYYAALWSVCCEDNASFSIPLVVDSPNQQGQDDINLPKVLSFLTERLPAGAQLIVGSEIDSDQVFDKKIVFEEPYKMLRDDAANEAATLLDPMVKAMHDAIKKSKPSPSAAD
jgi:hypothetical protein